MADVEVKIERTAWGGDLLPCAFLNRDVADKLGIIAALKPGEPFPVECEPNNWGSIISNLCAEARDEINTLRNRLEAALYAAGDS